MLTIYDQLHRAGVPLDSHESDLYARVCPAATAILAQYVHRKNVTVFVSQVDGHSWYDVPFAYDPYWIAKRK